MSLEEVKQLLLKAKAEVDEHRAQQPEWVSKMGEELRYAKTQNEKEQILKKYREEIDAQLESEKH